jgi:diguanylate cyclase (GGDEF)-like protein
LTKEESAAVERIRALAAIIAEHRSTRGELQVVDGRDKLTGLANGSAFAQRLQALIESGLPEDAPALFVFDLVGFQHLNERLGNGSGDLYVREAAERISKCFRSGDMVARPGAGNFEAVVPGLNALEAGRICRAVMGAFLAPFAIDGFQMVGDISIGVSSFPRGGRTPSDLRFSADAALADAKKKGGSWFTISSAEIRGRATSVANADRLIRQALEGCGCDLFYQPQITVNGGLFGMQAFVRMRLPGQPWNPEIDAWVLPEALRQYSEWLRKGLNPACIAVDVSTLGLSHAQVFDQIVSYLKTFELGPEAIRIELAEPAADLSSKTSLDSLWQLRSAAISVSLEVVGSTYSSLSSLQGLPVDVLKIGKSFVRRLTEPDGSARPVADMIAAAHVLRMTVIAGDVGTEEQMWSLRKMGCDVLQGDHIERTLTANAAAEILAARRNTRSYGT